MDLATRTNQLAFILGTSTVAVIIGYCFFKYQIQIYQKQLNKEKSDKTETAQKIEQEERSERSQRSAERSAERSERTARSETRKEEPLTFSPKPLPRFDLPPHPHESQERYQTPDHKPTIKSSDPRSVLLKGYSVEEDNTSIFKTKITHKQEDSKKRQETTPSPQVETKVSPKESRNPSRRGIQLSNWGSATHRHFLASNRPRKDIYSKSLKTEQFEKDSDDKIFRKTLDHIGSVFISRTSKSIRKIFRTLDNKYYGYLSAEAFRKVLDDPELGLLELTAEEKDTIVKYCNVTDGKIDYKEFFATFFEQTMKKNLRTQGKGTLKQIFIITRHGSRFPIHPIPQNSSWPYNEQFWKLYGGKLTPKGINQHYKLGSRLKQEYLQELRILDDSPILPELLHVYTSNTDRTILSVSSLVDGMFPYVSQSFIVEGEPDLTGKNYQGIRIHIADTARKWTPVLHGYKNNPKFDFIKKKAFENATLFKEVAKDPKYLTLLDKLWDMTHHECISPEKDIVKRFSHMGPLYNQISIERALKMPLFANTKNIYLTSTDEEMIETLAEESRHIHFTGNNSEEQRELGRAGAGLLPLALIDSFRKRINNLETREPPRKKIVLFSAHDYTIMSLLSHLGFKDWVLPNFAAYLIFELHRINSAYYVRLRYNPDPMVFKKSNELRDYIIPMNGSCTVMKDAPRGMMEYQEFERTIMHVKKSFTTEDEWYQDAHSLDEIIAEEAKKESK